MIKKLLIKARLVMVVCAFAAFPAQAADDNGQEILQKGLDAFERADIMGALPHLNQAAEMGYPEAQTLLAHIMARGEENEIAQKWYLKAAEQGYANAQFALAELAIEGKPGVTLTSAEGLEWLEKAVEQTHPVATNFLASLLETGRLGVKVDIQRASALYHHAAEAGVGDAMVRLIQAYKSGELSLQADPVKSAIWQQKLDDVKKAAQGK
ncbi:MAG: tetratricopeptide repeat protein [Motiliproteus sp.]